MDKKSSKYSQQSANKGATAESKKNQDVVNGKVFPRASRRREPPGANGYSKNEQSRKPNHQKTRNFDKRPKPKGQYHGRPAEDTKVVDEELAEFGSVVVQGSKKQNLNHLLNFHYEPRDIQGSSGTWNNYGRSNNYNNTNRWLSSTQRHKYNKELFLQANCQFVVTSSGDYKIHLVDPDTLVDWKLIEQIKIYTPETILCPICLSPPVAGKMTRCGHVYCWPCILHYLSLSDKNWRKCPICYESVHKTDLKSVTEVTQHPLRIGDTVRLRLMRRKRGSLLAVPVDEHDTPDPENFFTVADHVATQVYSKLLRADIGDVINIIEDERAQLRSELLEDPQSPENCFIEQALAELADREESILVGRTTEEAAPDDESEPRDEKIKGVEFDEIDDDGPAAHSAGQSSPKFFYFYQAEDGQHVYLHAMNAKMLELQYGDLQHCPRSIAGRVLEKEGASFTEDHRKRMRYLCHLPLTCSFEIAEIKLSVPLVSEDILALFREQVGAREKHRRRREREEKRREKKITAEENKRMGRYPTPTVHIESHKHFPQWQHEPPSASVAIPSPAESPVPSSIASSPSRSTFDDATLPLSDLTWSLMSQNDQGPSFAQMLRNEHSRMPTSMPAWPSVHASASSKELTAVAPDEYASAPAHSQSFGDVLALALEASTIHEEVVPKGKTKKSKKRGKATLLFASGMTRTS